MRNRKGRKKRWQQDVTLSFGVIASIESHNNADNKLECCLHSVFKVFSVLSMRLESDVDHLFFISNNSRTKHKTVKAISKHHYHFIHLYQDHNDHNYCHYDCINSHNIFFSIIQKYRRFVILLYILSLYHKQHIQSPN